MIINNTTGSYIAINNARSAGDRVNCVLNVKVFFVVNSNTADIVFAVISDFAKPPIPTAVNTVETDIG